MSVRRRDPLVWSAWEREWPEASTDPVRRDVLLDRYAQIHASALSDAAVGWDVGSIPRERDLVAGIVTRVLPAEEPRAVAVVMAPADHAVARAERSRPGWHLSGRGRAIGWTEATERALVLAVDEGDNEVLALVEVDAPGVHVAAGWVDVRDVDVADHALLHRPEVRAQLGDQLTVLTLADLLAASTQPVDEACRRAVALAARTAAVPAGTVARQHDVSVAVLAVAASGLAVDPGVVAWHRQRLTPLV